jgi:hypothetical protein
MLPLDDICNYGRKKINLARYSCYLNSLQIKTALPMCQCVFLGKAQGYHDGKPMAFGVIQNGAIEQASCD